MAYELQKKPTNTHADVDTDPAMTEDRPDSGQKVYLSEAPAFVRFLK